MSIDSDKLAYVQVIINCPILLHQSAHKAQVLGSQVAPGFLDDVMSYNSLTTLCQDVEGSKSGSAQIVFKMCICTMILSI